MFDAPPLDQFLPRWLPWAQYAVVPVLTFAIVYVVLRWSARIAMGPQPIPGMDQWWLRAERCNQIRPARAAATLLVMVVVAVTVYAMGSPLSNVTTRGRFILAGVAFVVAAYAARAATAQFLLERPYSAWSLLYDQAVTFTLFGFTYYFIALAVGLAMPPRYDAVALSMIAGMFLLGVGVRYSGHLWLLRLLGALRPAPQRASAIVDALAADIAPTVYEFRVGYANAFAFPDRNAVAFTSRIMEICDDDEIRAIAAHEVGHLRDGNMQRLVKLSWIVVALILLLIQLRPAVATWGDSAGLAVLTAALVLLLVLARKGKRVRVEGERHADAEAARQVDPAIYVRALEKLYRDLLRPVGKKSWLGHAALYDRMVAAGVSPAYERPQKKPVLLARWRGGCAAVVPVLACVFALFAANLWRHMSLAGLGSPIASLCDAAMLGSSEFDLLRAVEPAAASGERDLVRAVVARVLETSPGDAAVWAKAAGTLAAAGCDEEADAVLATAREIHQADMPGREWEVAWETDPTSRYIADIEAYMAKVRNSRRQTRTIGQ